MKLRTQNEITKFIQRKCAEVFSVQSVVTKGRTIGIRRARAASVHLCFKHTALSPGAISEAHSVCHWEAYFLKNKARDYQIEPPFKRALDLLDSEISEALTTNPQKRKERR